MTKYRRYELKTNRDFRLILKEGAPFPTVDGANPEQWQEIDLVDAVRLSDVDREDIETKGYRLFKFVLGFREIVGDR